MKTGSFVSVFRTAKYVAGYLGFLFLIVTVFHSRISHDQQAVRISKGLGIQLQMFSPAYAAFEDEYLFDEFDQIKSETIQAGVSQSYFIAQQEQPRTELMSVTPLAFQISLPTSVKDVELATLDQATNSQKRDYKRDSKKPIQTLASVESKKAPSISISIGPVVASSQPNPPTFASPATKQPSAQAHQATETDVDTHAHNSAYLISGPLELTGGVAFLGDLEVSWVVEDEELKQGQIALKEGYYEIPVKHLTGDIIVSLYDENDRLVGEGLANLDELSQDENFDPKNVAIQIKAIDTSLAGRILDGEYMNEERPVHQADITLFGVDESSRTNSYGQYHFPDWRALNSRTIAMASKEGYKDSVYIIDSSQTHEAYLFPNDHIQALHKQLMQMGYDSDVQELGLVYGRIKENGRTIADTTVSIDGYRTAYFTSYYIPTSHQKQTSENGLFAIPSLENGEHELLVERNGQVIDRRIVVVEEGKISPVVIDLGLKTKQVKFFDPLRVNEKVEDTGYRFFDGEEFTLARSDGRVDTQMTSGKDPALLEFAGATGDENNIFINRAKRFEQVPVVNTQWFKDIKDRFGLKVDDGIAVGFIKSNEAFVVSIAESPPDEILYFDRRGAIIKPSEDILPAGFILFGLEKGLHTLLCESRSGSELFFTDMVYNNHQSVSVIYKDLR